jgi:hypothetical protein
MVVAAAMEVWWRSAGEFVASGSSQDTRCSRPPTTQAEQSKCPGKLLRLSVDGSEGG